MPTERNGQALDVEVKLDLVGGATVPLSHSGTGIQQVLALLTGALVSKQGSLFLLDEPHSYLHPAAERGLIKTLERLGGERGHYFCVATHSPIFASHSRKRLYAVRANGNDGSKVRDVSEVAEILEILGIQNPDLFTYTRVVFVEGLSDEKVLRAVSEAVLAPELVHRLKIQPLGGDGILKNRSRAEFISLLHKANVSEVHVPIRFVLDSNDWSDDARDKLAALRDPDGQQVVYFLKLPELENYLLHPDAVAHAVGERLRSRNMSETSVDKHSITTAIAANIEVKGSDVLSNLFATHGCDYAKGKDVDFLLEYIAAHCPTHLDPLVQELSGVLGAASAPDKNRPTTTDKTGANAR